MAERVALSKSFRVPDLVFEETSALYQKLAEEITGKKLPEIVDARQEIISALNL
jgi:hypothetical protein